MSNITKSFLIVFLILLVDQVLKIWVKTNMLIGESSFEHWGWSIKWMQLRFIENKGMAFGMTIPIEKGKIILSLFRTVAIGVIVWYIIKVSKNKAPFGYILSLSLILAGAAGNLIDSAFYGLIFNESGNIYTSNQVLASLFPEGGGYGKFLQGSVVDMLYFPMINGTYPQWIPFKGGQDFTFFSPIFNIADASITVGVLIILVFQKRFFKEDENKKQESKLE